jgi:hypothetical protein
MNINHESEEYTPADNHEDLAPVQPRSARRMDTNFPFGKLLVNGVIVRLNIIPSHDDLVLFIAPLLV